MLRQKSRNDRLGFTLAEVLITLGIIGVVAAMTLPSLIQKQTEKATVAKVKKAYSVLQQAFIRATQENSTPDIWDMMSSQYDNPSIVFADKFVPYMNVIVNCIGSDSIFVKKNCTKVLYTSTTYSSFRTGDGSTFIFQNYTDVCNWGAGNTPSLKKICGSIFVDINGVNGPNIMGKDIFEFWLTTNGVFPTGTKDDTRKPMKEYCNSERVFGQNYNNWFANGSACTAWVLYNENMDYLRCDLDWDSGKSSCKY